MTCDAPVLSIIRLDASTVRLSWVAADPGDVSAYNLYRSTTPYFDKTGTPYQTFANPGAVLFDDAVLGNPAVNYFYALRAVCVVGGGLSNSSNEVGKFEYTLYETTGRDYTWIALPFEDPTLVMASDLATNIENNCDVAVTVTTISKWNAAAQTYTSYYHELESDDFAVTTGFPYRVEVNIIGAAPQTTIWVLVGNVPAITNGVYTLYETTGEDYTWIMHPLELSSTVLASTLATHIETYSSAPLAVTTVSKWNAAAQTYTSYYHELESDDFAARFGYPYRVEVNITTGSSVTWSYPASTGEIFKVQADDRIYVVEDEE